MAKKFFRAVYLVCVCLPKYGESANQKQMGNKKMRHGLRFVEQPLTVLPPTGVLRRHSVGEL